MLRLSLRDGLNELLVLMYNEPDFLSTKISEAQDTRKAVCAGYLSAEKGGKVRIS